MRSMSEAFKNIKRIIDESLKDYTPEERVQLVKQIMDDYKAGKE